jgi:glutamyl-Q tRNA(Asp) synthetase
MTSGTPIAGRFAPSPTGPLHLGSLIAALGSCLLARQAGGRWLVRIEDVDTTRNVPGAAEDILRTLDAFGFAWDGPVVYQTARLERYRSALATLVANNDAYPCACSRSEIEARATQRAVDGGWVYPGTCREGLADGREARAWRFRVPPGDVDFIDGLQGCRRQSLADEVGDFVLKRADGPFAYQLAVVVDDAEQGITQVVRGADLIDSTPRQIALQNALGVAHPEYLHLPVVVNAAGEKLSKQTRATPLDVRLAPVQLVAALKFLGQAVPDDLAQAGVAEVWHWAAEEFAKNRLPCRLSLPQPL